MPSKFGGVPVEETPVAGGSKFGGVAVEEPSTAKPPAPQSPSALSRFGTGLYQSTIQPMADTLAHPVNAFKGLASLSGVPQAFDAARMGDFGGATRELMTGPAQRMAAGTMEPIAADVKQGNLAGAAGRGLGTALTTAIPAVGESAGVARGLGAAKAGMSAAAPDLAMGLGKSTVGAGLGAAFHHGPYPVVAGALAGGRQMVQGLGKGMGAAAERFKDPEPYLKTPGPIEPRPLSPKPLAEPPPIGRPGYDPYADAPRISRKSVPPIDMEPPSSSPAEPPPTPAPTVAIPKVDQALLDGLSTKLAGKPYAKLQPAEQATVDHLAAKGTTSPESPARPLATPSTAKPLPRGNPTDIARQLADEGLKSGSFSPEQVQPQAESGWPGPEVFAGSRRPFKAMELAQPLHEVGITSKALQGLGGKPNAQLKAAVRGLGINKTGDISPETLQMTIEELKKLESPPAHR